MKNSMAYGILGLVILGAVAYGSGAFASQSRVGQFGQNYSPERHETMAKSFTSGDYATWKTQMAGRGAANVVTKDNFARFTEMHNLMLAGKTDQANKIRQEIGLGDGSGKREGRGMMSAQRGENRNGNFVDKDGDGKCDMLK